MIESGSLGHASDALAQVYSDFRFLVQNLPEVSKNIDATEVFSDPKLIARVESQPQQLLRRATRARS